MNNIFVTCAELLVLYGEADEVASVKLKELQTYQAKRYAFADIYGFKYNDARYYVTNDYSLNDSLKYVDNVLRDIDHNLEGSLLKNPWPQSDGAVYASGLSGVEYYLYKCAQ